MKIGKISSVTALLFVFLVTRPYIALAQDKEAAPEGDYTVVKEGEKVPYDGYLFDSAGLIKIITNKALEIERITINKDSEINKLNIQLDSLKKQHELEMTVIKDLHKSITDMKEVKIKSLEDANRWDDLKIFGAAFLGIALSVLIFFAAVQITNIKITP